MTTHDEVKRTECTLRDIAMVGGAAGLTAGVAMAMWATLTSVWHGVDLLAAFEAIGATFRGRDATAGGLLIVLYGLLLHGVTAGALGVLFCAWLPPNATSRYATAAGLGYGLAVLLAMTFVVTPVVNPVLRHTIDSIPKSWVIQHILFGATLGVVPGYWRYYRQTNDRTERSARQRSAVPVRHPALPAPRPLASFPRITRARAALRRSVALPSRERAAPSAH